VRPLLGLPLLQLQDIEIPKQPLQSGLVVAPRRLVRLGRRERLFLLGHELVEEVIEGRSAACQRCVRLGGVRSGRFEMIGLQVAVGLSLGLGRRFSGLGIGVDAVIKEPSLERTERKKVG
jgi:hypothetical protein